MEEFLDAASSRLPTLRGLKFTSPDLMEFGRCVVNSGGKFQIMYGVDQVSKAQPASPIVKHPGPVNVLLQCCWVTPLSLSSSNSLVHLPWAVLPLLEGVCVCVCVCVCERVCVCCVMCVVCVLYVCVVCCVCYVCVCCVVCVMCVCVCCVLCVLCV